MSKLEIFDAVVYGWSLRMWEGARVTLSSNDQFGLGDHEEKDCLIQQAVSMYGLGIDREACA